jgi:hypothetical protein
MLKVQVKGAASKIDQIFRFDKELWRDTTREIRQAGDAIAKDAATRMPGYPLRNWGSWFEYGSQRSLSYDSGAAKRITTSVRSRESLGLRVIKTKTGFSKGNAAGAIYGLAGSSSEPTRSSHPAGAVRSRNFKKAMNRRQGGSLDARNGQMWPRALTPAFYVHRDKVRKQIGAAVERAVAQVNR